MAFAKASRLPADRSVSVASSLRIPHRLPMPDLCHFAELVPPIVVRVMSSDKEHTTVAIKTPDRQRARGKVCPAVEAIIEEAEEIVEEF
jgi:hypothetical protein